MNKIPCETCIVLAICRSGFTQRLSNNEIHLLTSELRQHCEQFNKWFENKTFHFQYHQIKEVFSVDWAF